MIIASAGNTNKSWVPKGNTNFWIQSNLHQIERRLKNFDLHAYSNFELHVEINRVFIFIPITTWKWPICFSCAVKLWYCGIRYIDRSLPKHSQHKASACCMLRAYFLLFSPTTTYILLKLNVTTIPARARTGRSFGQTPCQLIYGWSVGFHYIKFIVFLHTVQACDLLVRLQKSGKLVAITF